MAAQHGQNAIDIINHAHHRREPDRLLDLLADDARFVQYDHKNGPGEPTVAEGKDAVAAVFEDTMSRDMTHTVSRQVVGEAVVAYHVDCLYPDGHRVAGTYVVSLDSDGMITEIVGTSVWDE